MTGGCKSAFFGCESVEDRKGNRTGRSQYAYVNMFFDFKKNRAWAENLTIVMQLGLTMAGCIAFCLYVGYQIDKWLGTKGIFISIFILFGIIGGGVVVYRQVLEVFEEKTKGDGDQDDGSEK